MMCNVKGLKFILPKQRVYTTGDDYGTILAKEPLCDWGLLIYFDTQ